MEIMARARRHGALSQLYKNKHTSQLDGNSPPEHESQLSGNKAIILSLQLPCSFQSSARGLKRAWFV